MHRAIIRQIEELGYAISVHQMGEYVELHAVPIPDGRERMISRVIGGDGPDDIYRAACELAQMVGIDLEG